MSFNGTQQANGFESELKMLGIPAAKRDAANPDVPTFGEQGLEPINVTGPMCMWAPKGLDEGIRTTLESAIEETATNLEFEEFLAKSGLAPIYLSGEEGVEAMNTLYEKLGPVAERIAQGG